MDKSVDLMHTPEADKQVFDGSTPKTGSKAVFDNCGTVTPVSTARGSANVKPTAGTCDESTAVPIPDLPGVSPDLTGYSNGVDSGNILGIGVVEPIQDHSTTVHVSVPVETAAKPLSFDIGQFWPPQQSPLALMMRWSKRATQRTSHRSAITQVDSTKVDFTNVDSTKVDFTKVEFTIDIVHIYRIFCSLVGYHRRSSEEIETLAKLVLSQVGRERLGFFRPPILQKEIRNGEIIMRYGDQWPEYERVKKEVDEYLGDAYPFTGQLDDSQIAGHNGCFN